MLSGNTVKYIQSLTHKKFRDKYNCFIAETPKVVEEFIVAGYHAEGIYATEEWVKANDKKFERIKEAVTVLKEHELKKISQLKTPRGVLAVFRIPVQMPPDLKQKISLALDDIQDPGNLGTIIRIADWFGIENILCSLHTADAFSPKVVQAAMGSLAHVNMQYVDLLSLLKNTHIPIYAACLEGTSIFETGQISQGILVMGNEGNGISENILALASQRITIPGAGRAESLNVAIATGIILSHLVRN